MKTCFISNLSEDVWPFIQSLPAKVQQTEIDENRQLSDRDLFAFGGEDGVLFILPQAVQPDFWNYYQELFQRHTSRVLVPKHHTGQTCADLLRDPALIDQIVAWAGTEPVAFYSYSPSSEFYAVIQHVRERGVAASYPESPDPVHREAVEELGTKTGIRQSSLPLVPGEVFTDWRAAATLAAKWWWEKGAVVLKTRKGHAGFGVMILRSAEKPTSLAACEEAIIGKLQAEPFWSQFPMVVEEFIDSDPTIGGGFPNAEFRIGTDGQPEYLYACGMRVTKAGVFQGVVIGKEVFSDQQLAELQNLGKQWGERMAQSGYRGYYDVDCIADKRGRIYVSESNVRRTGGTHVYATSVALLGKDFYDHSLVLSQNMCAVAGLSKLTFAQLLTKLQPHLFHGGSHEGVVITSANLLPGDRFGYIVIGQNYERALQIEAAMFAALAV